MTRGRWDREKVPQANKEQTARAELLQLAIEHFCTTELPEEEKLKLLTKTESYIRYVKDSATKSRQKFAEYKAEVQNSMC